MYKWDTKQINQLINYLNSLNNNLDVVNEDILTLKDLLYNIKHINSSFNNEIKANMLDEDDDYEDLKSYNNILSIINNKYFEEKMLDLYKYKKIICKKEDILDFTRNNIKNINKNWFNKLVPFLNDNYLETYLNFKKNSLNTTTYIEYLNKFYISIEKSNTVSNFITPTHEFLHVYTILQNNNFLNNIECEFLSILGELITSYEMKKNFLYNIELIKYDIETYTMVISYIKAIVFKNLAINENIDASEKKKYFKNVVKIDKKNIKNMYLVPLEYNYSFVISYFIALELFDIYLIDKEKCFYICDNIINSNKDLQTKLKNNNINILTHDNKYIKKLKKEYDIINNQ